MSIWGTRWQQLASSCQAGNVQSHGVDCLRNRTPVRRNWETAITTLHRKYIFFTRNSFCSIELSKLCPTWLEIYRRRKSKAGNVPVMPLRPLYTFSAVPLLFPPSLQSHRWEPLNFSLEPHLNLLRMVYVIRGSRENRKWRNPCLTLLMRKLI